MDNAAASCRNIRGIVPFVRAPDGRSLELEYDPGSGEWTARFAEANGRAVTGRWLLKVVSELLKLPDGEKPQWFVLLFATPQDMTLRSDGGMHAPAVNS
jgi:hypothetical protein